MTSHSVTEGNNDGVSESHLPNHAAFRVGKVTK